MVQRRNLRGFATTHLAPQQSLEACMTETKCASPGKLASMLSTASVEVSSRGHQLAELREHFHPRIDVTITFLPGDDYRHNVETAAALRRLGFNPVLHIAAREMRSRDALNDFLGRARGEAEVNRILVIAGDALRTVGPFKSSADICASGAIEANGIHAVSFAGHPEGHPQLGAEQAMMALAAKRDWGRRVGVRVDLVSQFCFETAPDSCVAEGARGARSRHSGSYRSGRSGFASDLGQVCFALRCRKLTAVGARPHRPLRPSIDGGRARRRPARSVDLAFDCKNPDRWVSLLSIRRPSKDEPMAA